MTQALTATPTSSADPFATDTAGFIREVSSGTPALNELAGRELDHCAHQVSSACAG